MFCPPVTFVSIEAIDCAPLSGAMMWSRLRAVPTAFTAASAPAVHFGPRNVAGSDGSSRETRGRTAPRTAQATSAELNDAPRARRPASADRAAPARGEAGRTVALWMYPDRPGAKRGRPSLTAPRVQMAGP